MSSSFTGVARRSSICGWRIRWYTPHKENKAKETVESPVRHTVKSTVHSLLTQIKGGLAWKAKHSHYFEHYQHSPGWDTRSLTTGTKILIYTSICLHAKTVNRLNQEPISWLNQSMEKLNKGGGEELSKFNRATSWLTGLPNSSAENKNNKKKKLTGNRSKFSSAQNECYARCDWSLSMIYWSRHTDDVKANLFSLFCPTWRAVLKMFAW